jgi:hypothetical protein
MIDVFLLQNQLEDHTCGFLASCAVFASSLLPPFARAISNQEVLSVFLVSEI